MRARESSSAGGDAFRERLIVPLWWWPLALGVGGLLAAEIHSGYGGVRAWLPYVVVGVAVLAGLVAASRVRLRVADGLLYAGRARLPVSAIGALGALDPAATRRVLGPDADPAAYVVTRPWVRTAVVVRLDDPADDTPYWLLATRRPGELVAALERARAAG